VEARETQLCFGGELDYPQEVLSYLSFYFFIAAMFKPHLELIEIAGRSVHKHTSNLITELELFANEAHK